MSIHQFAPFCNNLPTSHELPAQLPGPRPVANPVVPTIVKGSHMDDKNIKHERHQREALALRGLVTCEEVFAAHQREMGVLAEHAAAQMGDATGPLEEQLDKIAVDLTPRASRVITILPRA